MKETTRDERDKLWEAASRRYWNGFSVPRKIPAAGRVLVHNPVQPISVNQPHGMNGFRVWTQKPSDILLTPCKCGWSGLPHYRVRGTEKPHKIGSAAFQKAFAAFQKAFGK